MWLLSTHLIKAKRGTQPFWPVMLLCCLNCKPQMENCDLSQPADVTQCWFCSYLHLIGMETHEPLDSEFLVCACVVDVFSLLQTPLIHSYVRQLAELPGLLNAKATGNSRAWQTQVFLLRKSAERKRTQDGTDAVCATNSPPVWKPDQRRGLQSLLLSPFESFLIQWNL